MPVGLAILSSLPTAELMLVFGGFLVIYAAYSLARPHGAQATVRGGWMASSLVGMSGGVIGGFTAFPGAAVVVWNGLRHVPKREARAIVQPYIFVLQLLSIGASGAGEAADLQHHLLAAGGHHRADRAALHASGRAALPASCPT